MYLVAIFVLMTIVNAVPGPDDCDLVLPKEPVDWSKLPGDWYEILNSGHAMNEISSSCFGTRDYAPKRYGFGVTKIEYYLQNETYGEVSVYAIRQQSDLYNFASTDARHTVADANSQAVFYTDYENYIMYLVCLNKKDRLLWIHGRNQEATADDVLRIHNKLAEIGYHWGDMPLAAAGCGSADVRNFVKEELSK